MVDALLRAGADVNRITSHGDTALVLATVSHHTAVVKQLIAAGAHVNHADQTGRTALGYVFGSHLPTEATLLSAHALPGARTTLPSLHTRVLQSAGAPFALAPDEALPTVLAHTDEFARTALHYAALTQSQQAYRVLHAAMTEADVDTEGKDGGGYTAYDLLVSGVLVCSAVSLQTLRSRTRAWLSGTSDVPCFVC